MQQLRQLQQQQRLEQQQEQRRLQQEQWRQVQQQREQEAKQRREDAYARRADALAQRQEAREQERQLRLQQDQERRRIEAERLAAAQARAALAQKQQAENEQRAQAARAEAARVADEAEAKARHEKMLAKQADGEAAKHLALVDAAKATKAGVDLKVFGVPLGSSLELPACETTKEFSEVRPKDDVTCLFVEADGTSRVVWAKSVLPHWASSIAGDIRGDVLVAATIKFIADPIPPADVWCSGLACVGASIAQGVYAEQRKSAQEDVPKVHKQLRAKYGKPSKSSTATFRNREGYGDVVREVEEMDWALPGIHVSYDAGSTLDTVVIELSSIQRERAGRAKAAEEAEPKI